MHSQAVSACPNSNESRCVLSAMAISCRLKLPRLKKGSNAWQNVRSDGRWRTWRRLRRERRRRYYDAWWGGVVVKAPQRVGEAFDWSEKSNYQRAAFEDVASHG